MIDSQRQPRDLAMTCRAIRGRVRVRRRDLAGRYDSVVTAHASRDGITLRMIECIDRSKRQRSLVVTQLTFVRGHESGVVLASFAHGKNGVVATEARPHHLGVIDLQHLDPPAWEFGVTGLAEIRRSQSLQVFSAFSARGDSVTIRAIVHDRAVIDGRRNPRDRAVARAAVLRREDVVRLLVFTGRDHPVMTLATQSGGLRVVDLGHWLPHRGDVTRLARIRGHRMGRRLRRRVGNDAVVTLDARAGRL